MRGPERGSTATTRKRKHGDSHADAQWISPQTTAHVLGQFCSVCAQPSWLALR